jgi:hypothetical protein
MVPLQMVPDALRPIQAFPLHLHISIQATFTASSLSDSRIFPSLHKKHMPCPRIKDPTIVEEMQ